MTKPEFIREPLTLGQQVVAVAALETVRSALEDCRAAVNLAQDEAGAAFATALNMISEASAGWQSVYAGNPSTATPVKPGPWQIGTKSE